MRRALVIAAAAMLCIPMASGPAAAESDVEAWSELGLRHKLNKQWRLSASQGLRLDDTASRFNQSLTEVGATYRALRWLRLSAGYRFVYRQNLMGEFGVRHRLQADASARARMDRITGSYRLRFQEQLRGIDASDGQRHAMRHRLKASLKATKRITPFVAGEVFIAIAGKDGTELDKWRATLGASYDMKKKRELELFYRLEVPVADTSDFTVHILGLGYSLGI